MSSTAQFIRQSEPHWQAYVRHDFVCRLADGTLPQACFRHYLKQDYIYLFHYSRMFALAMYKSENFTQMQTARDSLNAVLDEIQLHIAFCREWGIGEAELFAEQESSALIAYTRYVLDCGLTGSLAELYAAIAPCMLGYAEIGRWIKEERQIDENHPYRAWIDTYADSAFQQSAVEMTHFIDNLCQPLTPAQLEKAGHIFTTATRMEAAFWDMGLNCSL
ncbi:thiaminase II [Neisseria animalis]|uniref:Aminopyrimidine aminohydrolase n=1 Tax=Neisseria animalis TaxID=492 RepID=A0A5P3MVE0_NEIAN|nr:thiaminase II [Neisseria animalis]QEY24629.1 thiaminase II [Neisseria animalis]ROW32958.1 thiaminase II [Neisseria animalis]VEE07516.1 Thiaminase-2 [Neisseria animalis]